MFQRTNRTGLGQMGAEALSLLQCQENEQICPLG